MTPSETHRQREGLDDVVRLALGVPGVHAVRVEPDGDGASLLRLELAEGADEAVVSAAVTEALRARRPPAPRQSGEDLGSASVAVRAHATVAVPELTAPTQPAPAASAGPGADGPTEPGPTEPVDVDTPAPAPRPASRPRTGRISVPSLASPTVAATPAPEWLGQAPQPPRAPLPVASTRLRLGRVQVATDGLTTSASVVLSCGEATWTGAADAPATAPGSARAVASATVRALESAGAGRLRADVDAVSLVDLGGRRTALVLLDVATARGPEQLVGAALVGADEAGGVVRAVLDAANRRLVRDLPTP